MVTGIEAEWHEAGLPRNKPSDVAKVIAGKCRGKSCFTNTHGNYQVSWLHNHSMARPSTLKAAGRGESKKELIKRSRNGWEKSKAATSTKGKRFWEQARTGKMDD